MGKGSGKSHGTSISCSGRRPPPILSILVQSSFLSQPWITIAKKRNTDKTFQFKCPFFIFNLTLYYTLVRRQFILTHPLFEFSGLTLGGQPSNQI